MDIGSEDKKKYWGWLLFKNIPQEFTFQEINQFLIDAGINCILCVIKDTTILCPLKSADDIWSINKKYEKLPSISLSLISTDEEIEEYLLQGGEESSSTGWLVCQNIPPSATKKEVEEFAKRFQVNLPQVFKKEDTIILPLIHINDLKKLLLNNVWSMSNMDIIFFHFINDLKDYLLQVPEEE